MSRKTVPILMGSIAILLIGLIVIIVVMLSSPERKLAQNRRTTAVKTLLSRDIGKEGSNLNQIAQSLRAPVARGGSLDNLNHFLTKDPGRRVFPGAADRRHFRQYMDTTHYGDTASDLAEEYILELRESDLPLWAPEFAGTARALFSAVRDDILILTGIPEPLTFLKRPESDERSVTTRSEMAVGLFASMWIPRGESVKLYETDRQKVRSYLLNEKRFLKRLETLDSGWAELAAALYNLSVNPRWITAVNIVPELGRELDELTILVLTADLHRRGEDLMKRVPGVSTDPGILWLPDFSYYKNIPEVTGQTADPEPTIYIAKVNIGYTFRDSRTQTWLNRRKDWLTDYFSTFFSNTTSEDFSPVENINQDFFEWNTARLKATALHEINSRIVSVMPLGPKGVFGVRDIAFVRVNLLANP